jgi:two-component SAPR family response regulator
MSHTNNNNISDSSDSSDNSDIDEPQQNTFENMDSQQDILKQIDRKIIVKYMKEGKNTKTYIYGLDYYMKPEAHQQFCKDLQKKKLGTSMIKRVEDDKTIYAFGGDHCDKIILELINTKIIPKNEIKKQ